MSNANEQLARESLLLRIFWMLIFTLAWYVAEVVLAAVVILQLGCRLVQGQPNSELLQLGDSLSQYLAQIGQFGTFNTEEKPWPFADWPVPAAGHDTATGTPGAKDEASGA